MRFQACIAEVRRASGVEMSEEQAADMFEAVAARFKTKRAKAGPEVPDGELFAAAAKELNAEAQALAAIEKRNAILNLKKRVARREFYSSAPDPVMGIEARLVGVNTPFEGSRLSVDAQQRALTKDYIGLFAQDLEATGTFENFRAGTLDREIARELFELTSKDGKPGVTGDPHALAMAKAVHAAQERARVGLNKAGAWIGQYEGYITRTTHDMDRIRRAGYQEWRDYVVDRLDERTFENVSAPVGGEANAREAFLRSVYDALVSGIHLGEAGYQGFKDPAFKGPANLAKKVSQGRVLHWKDANAWMDYAEKFGTGNLSENVVRSLEHAARHTALMREFGTNPRAELDGDIQWVRETRRQELDTVDKLREWEKPLHNRMDELDGTAMMPRNLMLAKWSAGIRTWNGLTKLGGVLLSAVTDAPLKSSELRYQGIGLLEAYTDGVTSLFRGRGRSEETRAVMDDLRAGFEAMRGNIASRFDANDTTPGTLSKLANTFFKMTGLTYWTDAQRDGAMFVMARHLGRQKDAGWDALKPETRRILGVYGIDGTDWELLRAVDWKLADGRAYLTPAAAAGIENTAIAKAGIATGFEDYRNALALKLHSYFADRADYAVLNPGARERAILRQGTQAGTIEGEAFRFVTQFKAFPVAAITRAWGRELYGGQGGFSKMAGIVHMMVATTLFGYAAMAAKDLAKGRAPRDPNDPKTWLAAFTQGGGAGIYGDFLLGDFSRTGRTVVETAAGPTISDAGGLVELWASARKGDDVAGRAFKFAIDHTPYVNLFYTRIALDYLFVYQVQEALNPGFLRRMERRIERDNNQQFILRPSDAIPYGGGNRLFEGVRK